MKKDKELINKSFVDPATGITYMVKDVQNGKVALVECSKVVTVTDLLKNWKSVNESETYQING